MPWKAYGPMDERLSLLRGCWTEFGLPKAIRTDNGVPLRQSEFPLQPLLSVWWLRLGEIERIKLGHPHRTGATSVPDPEARDHQLRTGLVAGVSLLNRENTGNYLEIGLLRPGREARRV